MFTHIAILVRKVCFMKWEEKPLLLERVHLYIGKHFQSIYTFIHLYINAFRAFVHWETHSEQIIGTGFPKLTMGG